MNDILRDIRTDFMNCQTAKEVDALIFQLHEIMDENRSLYVCAKLARRRISAIRRERIKSFKLQLN